MASFATTSQELFYVHGIDAEFVLASPVKYEPHEAGGFRLSPRAAHPRLVPHYLIVGMYANPFDAITTLEGNN